jgi:hypothetical protein
MNSKNLIAGVLAGLTLTGTSLAADPVTPQLAAGVTPQAEYESLSQSLVVANPTTIFSDTSIYSLPVGQLEKVGEPVNAIAKVKNSNWVLVGRDGLGIGYVSGSLLTPVKKASAHYPRRTA